MPRIIGHRDILLSLSLSSFSSPPAVLSALSIAQARGRFSLSALFSPVFPRCSLFLIAFLPHVGYPVSPRLIPTLVFSIHANAARRCLGFASSRKITALHACTRLLTFVPASAATIYGRGFFAAARGSPFCSGIALIVASQFYFPTRPRTLSRLTAPCATFRRSSPRKSSPPPRLSAKLSTRRSASFVPRGPSVVDAEYPAS